jgi:hypothetical protein
VSDDETARRTHVHWCLQQLPETTFRDTAAFPDADVIACLDAIASSHSGSDRVAADFRDELTRRATERHSMQVEVYAKKLDQQTTALICLTRVLAVLTAGLFALEVLRIAGVVH